MNTRIIDLTSLNSEQDLSAISALTRENSDTRFFEKNKTYVLKNGEHIRLSHSLIKSQDPKHADNVFYIITKEAIDSPGKGASSRFRRIRSQLTLQPDASLAQLPITGKGVRIKNTQYAQAKRPTDKPYQIDEAEHEYKIASHFPHLGLELPNHVLKNKPHLNLGEFFKSYSVMNDFPGDEFEVEGFNFINYGQPSTKQVIDLLILPTLERYQSQIANTGYVHRDLRPENIRFDYSPITQTSTINFIDVDSAKTSYEPDSPYGSPGYIPLEAFLEPAPLVSQARDIYALGMLLIGTINQDLSIHSYADIVYHADCEAEIIAAQCNILVEMNCYDPDKLILLALQKKPDIFSQYYTVDEVTPLFHYLEESLNDDVLEARKAIIHLLKQMTHRYAAERPTLETLIAEFKKISEQLALSQRSPLELSTAPSTPVPSSSSPMPPSTSCDHFPSLDSFQLNLSPLRRGTPSYGSPMSGSPMYGSPMSGSPMFESPLTASSSGDFMNTDALSHLRSVSLFQSSAHPHRTRSPEPTVLTPRQSKQRKP